MTGYDVTIFGIKMHLNPVAFRIPLGENGWDIYWYGIIIACGFLLALIFAMKNAERFHLNTDKMLNVVLIATPVSILSARAYYVIFDGEKLNGIGDFFGFGDSSGFAGLAIYGGVIGAFAAGLIACKIFKINILDMFDIAVLGFLIGQGVGRWGNFFNQEAYGTFTGNTWWGMTSSKIASEMGSNGLVHPCFLYESIWCILGFFVINHLSKKRRFSGETSLMYCVWYGFERTFLELIRTDSLMIGRLRVSSLLSAVLCITGAVLLAVFEKKYRGESESTEYTPVIAAENDGNLQEEENEQDN